MDCLDVLNTWCYLEVAVTLGPLGDKKKAGIAILGEPFLMGDICVSKLASLALQAVFLLEKKW